MLTLANIHAGSKVLVFETCAGLVLGAVMERMGGMLFLWTPALVLYQHDSIILALSLKRIFIFVLHKRSLFIYSLHNYPLFPPHSGYGSVIQMYPGGGPVRAGVESFGFPAHFHDMLHEFPICHVSALLAGTLDSTAKDPSAGRACCCFMFVFLFQLSFSLFININMNHSSWYVTILVASVVQ